MPLRIGAIHTAREERHRRAADGQRRAMRGPVDAVGAARHDHRTRRGQVSCELGSEEFPIAARRPSADDRDFSAVLRQMQDPRERPCRKRYTAPRC